MDIRQTLTNLRIQQIPALDTEEINAYIVAQSNLRHRDRIQHLLIINLLYKERKKRQTLIINEQKIKLTELTQQVRAQKRVIESQTNTIVMLNFEDNCIECFIGKSERALEILYFLASVLLTLLTTWISVPPQNSWSPNNLIMVILGIQLIDLLLWKIIYSNHSHFKFTFDVDAQQQQDNERNVEIIWEGELNERIIRNLRRDQAEKHLDILNASREDVQIENLDTIFYLEQRIYALMKAEKNHQFQEITQTTQSLLRREAEVNENQAYIKRKMGERKCGYCWQGRRQDTIQLYYFILATATIIISIWPLLALAKGYDPWQFILLVPSTFAGAYIIRWLVRWRHLHT